MYAILQGHFELSPTSRANILHTLKSPDSHVHCIWDDSHDYDYHYYKHVLVGIGSYS